MKLIFFACLLLPPLFFLSADAQETPKENTFILSGQFRPRLEYRAGAFRPLAKEEDPAALINSRIQISMEYNHSDLIKTRISMRNVNIWGQANPLQQPGAGDNNFGIFEGWVDLAISKNWHTKIGRQTISLDDERIFGISDWAPGARSHDALSVYYSKRRFKVETYFAFNQNYDALSYNNNINNPSGNAYATNGAQSYKSMQTIWAGIDLDSSSRVSFLFANLGLQNITSGNPNGKVQYLQTTGINYFLHSSIISGNISGYYQFGKQLTGRPTAAFLLAGSVESKVNKALSFRIGTDYLSGNSMESSTIEDHAFSPLFGTGHKFYGNMDYFFAGNPHGNSGLWDSYITATIKPTKQLNIHLAGHSFHSTADIVASGEKLSRNLGQEIDFNMAYKVHSFADVSAGYSTYFTTPELLLIKNVTHAKTFQGWAWISLNVNLTFFTTKF